MTRNEQIEFTRDLAETVVQDITQKIESGRIPEEWTGHELREILFEKFLHLRTDHIALNPRSELATNYRNTVLNRNL